MHPVMLAVAEDVRSEMDVVRRAVGISRRRGESPTASALELERDLRADVSAEMNVVRQAVLTSRLRSPGIGA